MGAAHGYIDPKPLYQPWQGGKFDAEGPLRGRGSAGCSILWVEGARVEVP